MSHIKTFSHTTYVFLLSLVLIASAFLSNPQAHAATTSPTGNLAKAVVRIEMGYDICSGAMISPSWVLTARHCVEDPDGGNRLSTVNDITIGDKPSQSRTYAGTVHTHPSTDLALININGTYNGPVLPLTHDRVGYNDTLIGAGFGKSYQKATTYKLTHNRHHDSDLHLGHFLSDGYRITHDAVGLWEPVTGDSGSPITNSKGEIVAVFSAGQFKPGSNSVFHRANNPDITRYTGWIIATAGLGNTSAGATDSGPSTISRSPSMPSGLTSSLSSMSSSLF